MPSNETPTFAVRPGDVRDSRLVALLEEHSRDMYATSPPESVHTLDLDALAAPDVRLLTVWETSGTAHSGDDTPARRSNVRISDECEGYVARTRSKRSHSSSDDERLLGCGALKLAMIDGERCGELKSMRTTPAARGRGVASLVLDALMETARAEGVSRLYLETGPQDFFAPARALYAKHGFDECGPFGDYPLDPYSFFMTRPL